MLTLFGKSKAEDFLPAMLTAGLVLWSIINIKWSSALYCINLKKAEHVCVSLQR